MDEIYIEVVNVEEHEDGSATYTFDMNEPAKKFFIKEGIMSVLMKSVKNVMEENDEKDSCCGTNCTNVGCRC